MRCYPVVAIALSLVLGLLIAGAGARAQGLPAVQTLAGVYNGFYQSALSPTGVEPASINITSQNGAGFTGILLVGGVVFPLEGTIGLPANASQPAALEATGFGIMGAVHLEGNVYLTTDATMPVELQASCAFVLADGSREGGWVDVVLAPQ